jgi:Ser/Thr protein kinase RdoA (MazF antagonist)
VTDLVEQDSNGLYGSFTVHNAVHILLEALDGYDLAEVDLKVLRSPADNAVIAIPKYAQVARIGVSELHRKRLSRELELARWLETRGVPSIRPADNPLTAQLTLSGCRVITWWDYLPSSKRGSLVDLGQLLARLHKQSKPWPDLPALDPWSRVEEQLAAGTGLPREDLTLLRKHWEVLRGRWNESRWAEEPSAVIHGDAYTGNTLQFNETTYLLDFEDSRIGPPQWDAASVAGFREVDWLTEQQYGEFCAAYGADVRDQPGAELLIEIVLFRRTCWYASRTGREPDVVEAVRHRIESLVDPSVKKEWLPG